MTFSLRPDQPTAAPAAEGPIKNGSTASFERDVIAGSMQTPVIVDFWAPWCGPCKQLTPALEKAVTALRGKVQLVKINVDENPEIAQALRIQSIPTVYAFVGGRPVDGFAGAVPDSQQKRFMEKLIAMAGNDAGGPGADLMAMAKETLEAGDAETAAQIYAQVLQDDPQNTAALAGLIRCRLADDAVEEAREMIDSLPAELAADKELAAVRSAIELAEQAREAGPIADLRKAVTADPDDMQARFDLGAALYAAGSAEAAIDELVEAVRRDRDWNEQAARKQLLKIFDALGPTDKIALKGRRKLSSLLFS